MSIKEIIAQGILGIALIVFIVLYIRSQTKKKIVELELEQKKREYEGNKKINDKYSEKSKTLEDRVGDHIDPADPWGGM